MQAAHGLSRVAVHKVLVADDMDLAELDSSFGDLLITSMTATSAGWA